MNLNKFLIYFLLSICITACNRAGEQENRIQIDTDFPGGNIIVVQDEIRSTEYYTITSDTVLVRPDFRDTEGDWFYWYFRVTGAAGKTLHFQFPDRDISSFGPAYSLDAGNNWEWLFDEPQKEPINSFSFAFPNDAEEVRFSMGMPYVGSDFDSFINKYKGNSFLSVSSLATTKGGRNVEKLIIKSPEKDPIHKVILTARHHAVEMMASYMLEGIISSILSNEDQNMNWLRNNVEFLIVPIMDKDGVESGDQGKNRRPRDHNLDYEGVSIYNSTSALREFVNEWHERKLKIYFDLHCPGLTGDGHEYIHLVGEPDKRIEKEQFKFAQILSDQEGVLNFNRDNVLKYGESWNVPSNYEKGLVTSTWMSRIEGIKLSSTFEFPYANNRGQVINPQKARIFGNEFAIALSEYLQKL